MAHSRGVLLLLAAMAVMAASSSVVFNEERSLRYLQFSWASYCPAASIRAWTCEWCVDKTVTPLGTVYDVKTELSGFVAYDHTNETIIISFRGSDNIDNWLQDFDFVKVKYPGEPGVQVHAGFYRCWKGVEAEVTNFIEKAMGICPTCTRAVFTGHSLGAAVTGLAALEVQMAYSNLTVEVINFGMPRVGDTDFAKLYEKYVKYSQRMVHQDDIVPHLPTRAVGYYHVSTEIWDRSNTTSQWYIVCDGSGEDPHCSDSVPAEKWSGADHDVYMGVPNDVCHNH